MTPARDALVFKRVAKYTALRRIAVEQVPQFQAHGWNLLISTTHFTHDDALETFADEVTKPLTPPRWGCTGE